MLRRLKNIPPRVAKRFPPAGPCLLCGFPDKRHRMFDSLAGMVRAGDSPDRVGRDFDVPTRVVSDVAAWWRE